MKWMYNMKCMIMPVIIGATGRVTKGLNKRFEAIPGKRSIDLLQKNITHNRVGLKLEGWAVGFAIVSWGETSGRKACGNRERNNNSVRFFFVYLLAKQPQDQLQRQHRSVSIINSYILIRIYCRYDS